jgi:hypothetical protein
MKYSTKEVNNFNFNLFAITNVAEYFKNVNTAFSANAEFISKEEKHYNSLKYI